MGEELYYEDIIERIKDPAMKAEVEAWHKAGRFQGVVFHGSLSDAELENKVRQYLKDEGAPRQNVPRGTKEV